MPVLRYWDVGQGAYVNAPGVQGPQGGVGVQGAPGLFPVDTIQNALQNVVVGVTPASQGARTKLFFTQGTITPDSTGKAVITFSTFGWTLQYGYVPVITAAIPSTGTTSTGFLTVTSGSNLTQLTVYIFNAAATAVTTASRFMLWLVGG